MDVRRSFWTVFGAANQVLFGITVLRLFVFLKGGDGFQASVFPGIDRGSTWIWVDCALAVQFAVLHSALLWPPIRSRLCRIMPGPLVGSFFCTATCASVFLTMELWHTSSTSAWALRGPWAWVMFGLYLASWAALTYSLWITGFGFQTGFTPWWAWVRRRATPRRGFAPKGAYKWIRHPIYLSFLGLIWFNPAMTADRLALAVLWTTHLFVGSCLKDRRLEHFIGEPYRMYAARIPGYPLLPGPLGRRPLPVTQGSRPT
jgi:protein-S-isoprenylcysteine O-methyltransferase Ste14